MSQIENFRRKLFYAGFREDSENGLLRLVSFERKAKMRNLNVNIQEDFLNISINADSFVEKIIIGILYNLLNINIPSSLFSNHETKVLKLEINENNLIKFGNVFTTWTNIITSPSFEEEITKRPNKTIEYFIEKCQTTL